MKPVFTVFTVFLVFSSLTAMAQRQVTLGWDAVVPTPEVPVTGYNFYKSEVNNPPLPEEKVNSVAITTTTYTIPAYSGKTYYYGVKAFNDKGESAFSNIVTYTAPINYIKTVTDGAGRTWQLDDTMPWGKVYLNGVWWAMGYGNDLIVVDGICYVHGDDSPQQWWWYDFAKSTWTSAGTSLPASHPVIPTFTSK